MFTPKLAAVAQPIHFGLCLASVLLTWACDSQEPAFKEDRTTRALNSDDATSAGKSPYSIPSEASTQAGGATGSDSIGSDRSGAGGAGGSGGSGGVDSTMSDGRDDLFAGGDGLADAGADGGLGGLDSTGGADSGGMDAGGADGRGADGGGADGGGADATGGADSSGNDGASDSDGSGDGTDSGTDGSAGPGGEDGIGGATWRTVEASQPGAGKVDILWIVDTSGSMSEEQSYLANNFNAMINQLTSAGHSFQTAVTTTDVCQDTLPPALEDRVCPVEYGGTSATHLRGSFRGAVGRKVLKQGDSDIVQKFNEYTKAGIDGSGFEHGLYAAKLGIDKVLSGQNEALVRPDAFLAVIVVSDEEDDGIGLSLTDAYHGHNFWNEGLTRFRYTEDNLISYLRGVKGEGKFSISSIAPTRKTDGTLCSAPHTQPLEEGTQYIKAAQKSGGILQSLCDTNWSTSLAKIGLDLSAQIAQIVLPSKPDVATIKVTVNGVQTAAWTYNAGNNAVKFNTGSVPTEGSAIKVTYRELP